MTIHQTTNRSTPPAIVTANPQRAGGSPDMKAVELELAIGAQDVRANGFEESVRAASNACGFSYLFNLPTPETAGYQRVAALAAPGHDGPVYVFVGLNSEGNKADILDKVDDWPHLESFAEAYFDLLTV